MQRLACILLALMSFGLTSDAFQRQVRGQVVNRDGVPQQCQVDFFAGSGTDLQDPTGHGPAGVFLLEQSQTGRLPSRGRTGQSNIRVQARRH